MLNIVCELYIRYCVSVQLPGAGPGFLHLFVPQITSAQIEAMAFYDCCDGGSSADLAQLFQGGDMMDCNIKTGTLSEDSPQTMADCIPAHKVILSMRSPVFRAMFHSSMSEAASSEVFIPDFDTEVVRQFVRYIYESKLPKESLERYCDDLLVIACKYQVPGLQSLCEKHFAAILDSGLVHDKICSILHLAELHLLHTLKEQALGYIKRHAPQVVDTDGFLEGLSAPLALDVIRTLAGPNVTVASDAASVASSVTVSVAPVDEEADMTDLFDHLHLLEQEFIVDAH